MCSLILVLPIIIWGLDGALSSKVPLLTALITHRSPLSAFPEMVLTTFPTGRVGSIVLFGGLMVRVFVCLIIPLSFVTILVLSLQLTTLLTLVSITTVLVSTLLSLFLPVLKHTFSHLFEFVKVTFGPISTLNAIRSSGRLVSSTFYRQRYVRSKYL